MGLLGLLWGLCDEPKKTKNNSIFSDDEIARYGLDPHEEELVRKGLYNPWDFDEEEMDEDSYYYEDDGMEE